LLGFCGAARRERIRPEDRDESWMEEALRLAEEAGRAGEVPVGAIVVLGDEVAGRGRNRMREKGDPRAHAEMEAIDAARTGSPGGRLDGGTLVVTLEPCPLCAGAILLTRLSRVVFGAWDPRLGAAGSRFDVLGAGVLGDVRVRPEVLPDRCSSLLSAWFRERRR
jgi:tRNA(adenine34) deaminase